MADLYETHSGIWQLGDLELPCAVLSNGKRVISGNGLRKAFDYKGTTPWMPLNRDGNNIKFPSFLVSNSLKPFISDSLAITLTSPITWKGKNGGLDAFGYEATILPGICKVFIDASRAGKLQASQLRMADAAEALIMGFATVGIVAIIDEVTGYQQDRDTHALQTEFRRYLVEQYGLWVNRVPQGFFVTLAQLYRKKVPTSTQHGRWMSGVFHKAVIEPLLPERTLKEIKVRNPPIDGKHRRRQRYHQWLTEDIGQPLYMGRVNLIWGFMRSAMGGGKDTWWHMIKDHDDEISGKPPQLHLL